ncbi:MAG: hypothetical protein KME06_20550 [Kastovskya adunca ATA6-11-RM4]|jgi:hypothetical protein|nr:hypothetical protein [Kastovskya adunca ATA6-11-RM4]
MEETIKIRAVDRNDWSTTLQGFGPEEIQQLLAVYSSEQVVGTICESVDGKFYVNGLPEMEYFSLQAAAASLFKDKEG